MFTSLLPWQPQKYLSHGDDILTEAGLSNRTASPSLSQKSSTCKVCLNEVIDIASLPCEHTVCKVSAVHLHSVDIFHHHNYDWDCTIISNPLSVLIHD